MAPSEGKTFRLRGIPAGLCKKDVEILVQNTLNCNDVNIRVRSLASDLDNLDEDVATVEISPVPIAFKSTAKGDEWCLDTVYNDEDLSLLFDTNFLGPTPLHMPSYEKWDLDLVAVSGLGGHAFGSFKARGGSFMWLRDALPKDLPGARVIVYGTDTTLQEGNSFQNLSHLGHGLRSTLNEIRAQFADKPLVLLGHSLGGVIIKENDQGVWKMEGPATVFVSKDSAKCLRTWETEIQNTLAMNRTHSEMVKFPNKHDRGYSSIRKRLKDFALKSAEVIPRRHAIVGITTYPGISPNSLTLEKREELKNVASFFIYGQGVPLQKSRMGLYSALIHQLYQPLSTAFQGLIWDFQNRTDTRGKYGEKWRWTLEDIRSHLFDALKLGSETKSIMIFVDALDEAGEEEARKIIRDFDGLLDGLSKSNSKIKVCFSCRHYPDLRLSHAVAVSVEEHNRRDIQTVIDDILQQLAPEEQTMFKTKIVKNSKGIFHWATLVVDRAVRQRKKGKPFRTVFSTFQEGQADLYQLYEALLSELDGDDRVQAIRLFQWILFAKRPLKLPELQHAMALSHDMPENSISDYSFGKYFTDANDLEARIMDLSKGLIEVRDPVNISEFLIHPEPTDVHFIHQSVVDYLLDSGIQTLEVVQDTTISSSINMIWAHIRHVNLAAVSGTGGAAGYTTFLKLKANGILFPDAIGTTKAPQPKMKRSGKISPISTSNATYWTISRGLIPTDSSKSVSVSITD
ncbi:Protein serac1 [Lasiodiplodia theobromae]|uniref:Protein serac1 n=1 Tax=Lasiodiplodia theobromae TaxID=45133 RepID=UPI0015C3401F|nr:Protein serac1 [Lasiodiplodia theobromae]KAF4541448.1 Protein serac1 [Lasiodiplodia theobromae]